jgi:hypothetical protein
MLKANPLERITIDQVRAAGRLAGGPGGPAKLHAHARPAGRRPARALLVAGASRRIASPRRCTGWGCGWPCSSRTASPCQVVQRLEGIVPPSISRPLPLPGSAAAGPAPGAAQRLADKGGPPAVSHQHTVSPDWEQLASSRPGGAAGTAAPKPARSSAAQPEGAALPQEWAAFGSEPSSPDRPGSSASGASAAPPASGRSSAATAQRRASGSAAPTPPSTRPTSAGSGIEGPLSAGAARLIARASPPPEAARRASVETAASLSPSLSGSVLSAAGYSSQPASRAGEKLTSPRVPMNANKQCAADSRGMNGATKY